jgi:hypothetical protein
MSGMGRCLTSGLALVLAIFCGADALAQNASTRSLVETVLPTPTTSQTDITLAPEIAMIGVSVSLPKIEATGPLQLDVFTTRPNPNGITAGALPVTQARTHLSSPTNLVKLVLTKPETDAPLYLDATLRDAMGNLLAQLRQPEPYSDTAHVMLKLEALVSEPEPLETFDFFAVETVSGKVSFPRKAVPKAGSTLYVQLLENALAGANRLSIEGETVMALPAGEREVAFELQRGLYERADSPALALKAWVEDPMGRKSHVMSVPVDYNGAEIDYALRLDNIRQGRETKRGRNLPATLMAQTLVQGEAAFDPVNGIPGEARLKVVLRQDRGAYNANPVLAEQTLLLRGMETNIPFSLTTDSTHFDPYAPAPFLIVSLTDSYGRVYYDSGEVRAREGRNAIRLYPR